MRKLCFVLAVAVGLLLLAGAVQAEVSPEPGLVCPVGSVEFMTGRDEFILKPPPKVSQSYTAFFPAGVYTLQVATQVGHPERGCQIGDGPEDPAAGPGCNQTGQTVESITSRLDGASLGDYPDHGTDQWKTFDLEVLGVLSGDHVLSFDHYGYSVNGEAESVVYKFVVCRADVPSPTPTATYTHTPTATFTSTPSHTATMTPSSTPTETLTPTATPSNTPTETLTPTATNSATPSNTATATPSNTPTATATSTDAPSATSTATFTPSATVTGTVPTATTPPFQPSATPTQSTSDLFCELVVPDIMVGQPYQIVWEDGAGLQTFVWGDFVKWSVARGQAVVEVRIFGLTMQFADTWFVLKLDGGEYRFQIRQNGPNSLSCGSTVQPTATPTNDCREICVGEEVDEVLGEVTTFQLGTLEQPKQLIISSQTLGMDELYANGPYLVYLDVGPQMDLSDYLVTNYQNCSLTIYDWQFRVNNGMIEFMLLPGQYRWALESRWPAKAGSLDQTLVLAAWAGLSSTSQGTWYPIAQVSGNEFSALAEIQAAYN